MKSCLQESGDLELRGEPPLQVLFLLQLVFKGRRQHVGEKLESHGQKQLHEGD